jgi:hypothetical protein
MPVMMGLPHTGVSYTFDTDTQMWKFTQYGSNPQNLAFSSTLAWDAADDADGKATSGSLKGTVPFLHAGDRIDFQAFSVGTGKYDWTGFQITAKVKLVSGGNIAAGCPLSAWLYVSDSNGYTTTLSPAVNLQTGSWVNLTYDLSTAGVQISSISQTGVQITTGACPVNVPDAGTSDAAGDLVSDAIAAEAGEDAGLDAEGVDAHDGGLDAADGGLDGVDAITAADAGTDAATDVAPPPPVTATTAVILIDDVIIK